MRRFSLLVVFVLVGLIDVPSPAFSHGDDAKHPVVKDAWARPTGGRKTTSAAYFTVHNPSEDAVAIVGASSDVSEITDLHETSQKDGMMRMRPAGDLVIAPGDSLAFEPGGLHVMLIRLNRPLAEGETFKVMLQLLNHDPIEIDVAVQSIAPDGLKQGAGHGHH